MKLRNIFLGTCAALALPLTSSAEDKIDFNEVVKKIKIKGDYRLRYERTDDGARDRWRQRARVSFTYDLNNDIEFGIRLATGDRGSDTSTNETLGFATGGIHLDRAYFKYTNKEDNYSVTVGQQADPFLRSNIFFDSDINPAGITFQIQKDSFFATIGSYAVDEVNTDTAYLHAIQLGFDDADNSGFIAAIAYYHYQDKTFNNPYKNIDLYASYQYGDYTLLGQYTINKGTSSNRDTAWVIGVDAKVMKDLKVGYKYVNIEKRAINGNYDDGDFGSGLGATMFAADNDKKGHILYTKYALCDSSSLTLTYRDYKRKTSANSKANLIQLDLGFKF